MDAPYDVAIIGAGPAGSACALTLARQAPEVAGRTVVLEKARHPREKYCAGAISHWGVDLLGHLGVPVDVPHVPVSGIRVRYGEHSSVIHADGLGIAIRRIELDARLAARAKAAVGQWREGEPVQSIDRDGDCFRLSTPTASLRARIIVGADGAGSAVRKLVGFPEPRRRAHLYVVETPPSADEPGDGVLTFDLSCVALGVQGYYWDFPTVIDGAPAVSRGIYHLNADRRPLQLKAVLRAFLARRHWDIDTLELKPFSVRGYAPGAEIARPGVLLAGEAAGVDPVTGEGIAHAIAYGTLAGRAIIEGLGRSDLSFSTYSRAVRKSQMGRHLAQAALLAPHVYGPRAHRWASFLVSDRRALSAGVQWFCGQRLDLATKVNVGARLVRFFAMRRDLPRP